jgi:hypothetical protein
MKFKNKWLSAAAALLLSQGLNAQGPGLIISEFMANPPATDSPFEYVEFVATRNIDFTTTPYTVIVTNNGNATTQGWLTGGAITYAFQINSGSVAAGNVVYVGGTSMAPTGQKLRAINTGITAGDGLGSAATGGVIGNGGANCDGIGVFNLPLSAITNSTVPVDAIFFGAGAGTAVVNAGANGYQLPVNDMYSGGKLQTTSTLAPDPASGDVIIATGTYDRSTATYTTPRVWAVAAATDNATAVTLTQSLTPVTLSFATTHQTVNENAGTATFNVNVTNPNAAAAFVDLSVRGISTAGSLDASVQNITLQFPAGSTTAVPVTVNISDDATVEATEYLVVSLNGLVNATAGSNNIYSLYIKDNDAAAFTPNNELVMDLLTSFSNGASGTNSAEIVAHDPSTQRLYIANSIGKKMDIVNFSNPSAPSLLSSIDITPYGNINSIAVRNGLVACAVEDINPQDSGWVCFFDAAGAFIKKVRVGAMPDNITFSHNGNMVVTANEGEPNATYTADPNGSVTVVDLSGGIASVSQSSVSFIEFTAYNGQEATLRSQGIRIFGVFGGASSASQDFEPEYVTISEDDQTAWVTLQENNAIVKIDLVTKTITGLYPLGYKNHALPANAFDISDQTNAINISSFPVRGLFMPDAIAKFEIAGTTYLVTANEGDAREYGSALVEPVRLSSASLDATAFPFAAELKKNYIAGRLNITTKSGDADNDGDIDTLYTFGSRSFSIWNASTGALVYDSGDDLEQITSAHPVFGAYFNASNSGAAVSKNRSDDKGPEPEGVATATINGHQYLFLALERIGGVMVFNIDNPLAPAYVTYKNNRTGSGTGPDLGAEGIIFIKATDSPNGKALVILANEISSTLSIYQTQTCVESIPVSIATNGATTICAGEEVDIYTDGQANYTYQWIKDGSNISGATDSIYTANAAGTYSLNVTSVLYGCNATTANTVVNVNALPNVGATATETSVCIGDSLVFNGTGASTYAWDNGVTNGQHFTPSATATYEVTGTDANGCENTASITIPVNALPVITATSSANPVCENANVTLNGNGGVSYVWNGGVTNNTPFPITGNSTFIVTGTDANGCSNNDTIDITMLNAPNVVANASALAFCEGGSVTLNGSGAVSYVWTNGVTNGLSFVPSATATYTVTGTDANGCTNTDQVTVTVYPTPAAPVITASMDTLFSTPAADYLWFLNGSSLGGQTNDFLVVTANGTYTVEITDANGCTNTSAAYVFNTLGQTSIQNDLKVEVYPNPFNNQTFINIQSPNAGTAQVQVFDAIGKLVSTRQVNVQSGDNRFVLNGNDFGANSGIYFITIVNGNETITMRVIKQ